MLKSLLLTLATSYFAWYMERHETAMIYPFDPTYATPEQAGEPRLSETRITTRDGEELIVWQATARHGRPTLMYFPGNSGNLEDRAERFGRLIDRGYGITALAYRGSSGSSGEPEETVLTEDAVRLAQAQPGRPLVLYGESLGTAVAIKLASKGIGDALILEAPFTSFSDVVAFQYPHEQLDHLLTQRWDSLSSVGSVSQPLLVIHGAHDRLVPIKMGQQIFDRAASAEKYFAQFPGRGHGSLWAMESEEMLYRFLDSR